MGKNSESDEIGKNYQTFQKCAKKKSYFVLNLKKKTNFRGKN